VRSALNVEKGMELLREAEEEPSAEPANADEEH
jgi:hypothetical protein